MAKKGEIRDLVRAAQEGERAAFEQLAGLHRSRLERMIGFRLGDSLRRTADLQDVLQETQLRALRSIGAFRYEGEGSFLRWLTGIADKVILELARRERRRPGEPLDEGVPGSGLSPSRAQARTERFERLRHALARLSPDHRRAITLTIIEGLPVKEVAARMERSPNALSQLLIRALKKLKEEFGDTESLRLPDLALLEGEDRDDSR